MKNINYLLILVCLFVLRFVVFSGGYPDALCLVALLGYFLAEKYINTKVVSDEMADIVQKNKENTERQMQLLADEIQKAKNSADGIKAAINFASKK